MKLAYILNRYPHGQTHIVNELKALAGAKIDVHIIALRKAGVSDEIRVRHKTDYPATYLFGPEQSKGWCRFAADSIHCMLNHPITCSIAAIRSLRWAGENFKLAVSFVRVLESIKPALVYVNWSWSTCGSVMYACRILKLPFIFSVQGTDIMPPARNFSLRAATAQKILTPSNGYVKILQDKLNVPPCKIRLVPNCLNSKAFEMIKLARHEITGPLRLVNIGTLRPVKRHEDIIRCCAFLQAESGDVECRIFGEGPDRKKLEALIAQLDLTEKVFLMGHVPQEKLFEQLEWCDIYVHTSESEAFAHAILEAQASARPVVLSDGVGGIRDSVVPGKTALMVPVGAPQELAQAIRKLANNPEKRLRMGQKGREFVKQSFTFEHFRPIFLKALFD